ncbi:unnamed protein product, partial [Brenthis ino]
MPTSTTGMARVCRKCNPLRRRCTLYVIVIATAALVAFLISSLTVSRYPKDSLMQEAISNIQDRMDFLESLYLVRHEDIIDLQDSADVNRTNSHGTLLLRTNKKNSILKPEIIAMLRNISGMRAAMGVHTSTSAVMQTSFIYKLLSHLMNDAAALRPAYHMTAGRKLADVVIGIPTVKRDKESYLMVTLTHLIHGLTAKDINNTLIVVYVGETDLEYVLDIARQIEIMFPHHVESGLIEVISPSPSYYPDLEKIPETLGDSHKRVKWRTKQNLDTIYLMAYAQSKGTFYLMLEDDVIAKNNYMQEIKHFTATSSISTPNCFFILICLLIGLWRVIWRIACAQLIRDLTLGKIQKVKDPQFNLQPIYYPHNNPPMKYIRTSIKEHSEHTLKKAYEGQTFFWGVKPKECDTIEFWFAKPTVVTSYTFRSGNVKHTSYKFYDTAVEVYPERARNFTTVDYFDEFGLADGKLKHSIGPLLAMRLRVNKNSFFEVILSEIDIRTDEKGSITSQALPNSPVKKFRQQDRPHRKPFRKLRVLGQISV